MTNARPSLVQSGRLDFTILQQLCRKPAPFAPGEPLFWDDEHISQQMLAAHLDPHTDVASRGSATIDREVAWLLAYLDLHAGDSVLDLGCGPGLYCERFSRAGLAVTGLDYSRRSITYAQARAAEQHLAIRYLYGDYLKTPLPPGLHAIFLIYGDFCVLPDAHRDLLLRKVRTALRDGGHFVFDVTTRRHRQRAGVHNGWSVMDAGFWRASPHLVLTQGFDYPEDDLYLDQYVVLAEDGSLYVYRNWFHDYSLASLTPVLAAQGFTIEATWRDLAGTPYDPAAEWIGLAARVR